MGAGTESSSAGVERVEFFFFWKEKSSGEEECWPGRGSERSAELTRVTSSHERCVSAAHLRDG